MVNTLKTLVKRHPFLVQIYYILTLLPNIPLRDYRLFSKLRLIFKAKPYSGISYPRLSQIYELSMRIEQEQLPGQCVECGVWNGGSAGIIAEVIRHNPQRQLWLFDSWEGLPEPTAFDVSDTGLHGEKGMALGEEHLVRELLFTKLRLSEDRIHLVKGWFQDTLPPKKQNIGKIALLHLDCDWYESIKLCLEELYDQLVDGGFVVIDDYGYWQGCKKAVDEFFTTRNLNIKLITVDPIGVFFQKPSSPISPRNPV